MKDRIRSLRNQHANPKPPDDKQLKISGAGHDTIGFVFDPDLEAFKSRGFGLGRRRKIEHITLIRGPKHIFHPAVGVLGRCRHPARRRQNLRERFENILGLLAHRDPRPAQAAYP